MRKVVGAGLRPRGIASIAEGTRCRRRPNGRKAVRAMIVHGPPFSLLGPFSLPAFEYPAASDFGRNPRPTVIGPQPVLLAVGVIYGAKKHGARGSRAGAAEALYGAAARAFPLRCGR